MPIYGKPLIISSQSVPPSEYSPYITFSSEDGEFTLNSAAGYESWDGTLYYSTDTETWIQWTWNPSEESSEISSSNGVLYLRGEGHSRICDDYGFYLAGTNISCTGNIENLLDWQTVQQGQHPVMSNYCFSYFCASLFSKENNL